MTERLKLSNIICDRLAWCAGCSFVADDTWKIYDRRLTVKRCRSDKHRHTRGTLYRHRKHATHRYAEQRTLTQVTHFTHGVRRFHETNRFVSWPFARRWVDLLTSANRCLVVLLTRPLPVLLSSAAQLFFVCLLASGGELPFTAILENRTTSKLVK